MNEEQTPSEIMVKGFKMGCLDRHVNRQPNYRVVGDTLVCVEYDWVRAVTDDQERDLALGYVAGFIVNDVAN